MFVSYDVNDETIERLACRNRELREELERVEEAADRRAKHNVGLAKKINELRKENENLNAEIDSYRAAIRSMIECMTGLANKLTVEAENMSSIAKSVEAMYLGKCS